MTNEEKAIEIANKYCVSDYKNNSGQLVSSYDECYCSALAIAEWKDEQFEKEKQKLIDKACKWLTENDSYAVPTNLQVDRLREHLNNLK